jgi:hypothetical protein
VGGQAPFAVGDCRAGAGDLLVVVRPGGVVGVGERPRHQRCTRPGRRHSRTDWPFPSCRPDTIAADGGYDSQSFRDWLRAKRIEPIIPQRGRKRITGLGRIRWVVEQTIAHFHQFKRLAVRWERRLDLHPGFVTLASASEGS